MIPSDGGGLYTDWRAYDIEAMHNLVQSVGDDQISTSWDQVRAWQKTHELLDDHTSTIRYYRQGLVDRWPPDKSPAAAAFITYVDELIDSLQKASADAKVNERVLGDLTHEVTRARDEVRAAYQEHAANQAKLDASPPRPRPVPSRYPVPTPSPAPPAVPPGRQEELTQRARDAMVQLSGVALRSSSQMKVPEPYTPPGKTTQHDGEHIDPPAAVMMTPPVIPAPRTSASQAALAAAQVPSAPFPTGYSGDGAPVLTGGTPTLPQPPTVTPNPPTGLPSTGGPGVVPLPGIVGPLGAGGGKTSTKGPGLPKVGPLGGGTAHGPAGPLPGIAPEVHGSGAAPARPLPPGGVIGGPPAMGEASPGGAGGGRAGAAPRVNPVGGVLGQGAPTAGQRGGPARTHAASGTVAGQPVVGGQRRTNGERDRDLRHWDPDDPWAMEHGVSPVLEPGREPTSHEPGPGVIGIDR
ncbi:hypothetical protein HC028_12935 [Planosporangium flavigriseum]|uniref:PPE family protein n=1 Tax=Planosporangium flavigriseum TaxID=373681 RepID=A0A8J3LHV2_9ACTN|nr:hypothetical protein [Planosporangium flavigriseum]NJC65403.1 hypothetical protein [Planosporangium flavigriseum]GIG73242.1 hypothetical protein Pfl04_16460 [Planosporangium flavigriseum]